MYKYRIGKELTLVNSNCDISVVSGVIDYIWFVGKRFTQPYFFLSDLIEGAS